MHVARGIASVSLPLKPPSQKVPVRYEMTAHHLLVHNRVLQGQAIARQPRTIRYYCLVGLNLPASFSSCSTYQSWASDI